MAGKQTATGRGEIATVLLQAAIAGTGFPEGQVPDTPENRALFAEIDTSQKDLAAKGIVPDVPYDYSAG